MNEKPRDRALIEAGVLINGDREKDYGSPQDNFATIAELWSAYRGELFVPADVAVMMTLLKLARLSTNLSHRDSWVDGLGYLALGAELAKAVE